MNPSPQRISIDGTRIVPLARHPEHAATIARWLFAEWGISSEGGSLERAEGLIRKTLLGSGIPSTLIAVTEAGAALGMASLVADDLEQGDPWSPWLASVYVRAEARRQGLGSRIVAAAEEAAERLRIPRLYLFTTDRERFYGRMGWGVIDRRTHRGQAIAVMAKDLPG